MDMPSMSWILQVYLLAGSCDTHLHLLIPIKLIDIISKDNKKNT